MNKNWTTMVLLLASALTLKAQMQQLSERYSTISREIFFTGDQDAATFKFPSPERTEELTSEMHSLLQAAIENVLTGRNASAESVEKAAAEVQGPVSLAKIYPEWSNVPFAHMASVHGEETLVVAFAILRGGLGIPQILPYIQFYTNAGGIWTRVASAGSEFKGRAFSVARISSPSPNNELWYVAWGKTVGDTGVRLKLVVYGFDGTTVRSVWTREVPYAWASVVSGRVRLEYEEHPNGDLAPGRHVVEMLRPGLNGLEREYSDR